MDQGHAGLAFVLWLVLAGGSNAWAAVREPPPTSEACLACHSDPDLKKELEKGRVVSLFVDAAHLARSPHKGFTCVQCHADIREVPHTQPPATPGVEVCQGCHRKAVAEYRESAHWGRIARGETGAPTCRSCHGPAHGILSSRDPASSTYHLNLPRTCAQCHADPELVRRYNIPGANVYQLYMDSIHGRALTRSGLLVAANCSDCHGHHDIRRRTDPAARVYRTNIPGTCGRCHAGLREQYEQGVHGIAVKGGNTVAPVCADCHTAHQIRRVEMESWKLEIVKECGTCHAESLRTYRDTFHGQVTALGFTRVARCSDCHGAHDIRPSRDPRSPVHLANRVATCRKCHASANVNFAKYDPHADPDNRARNPLLYYAARFMTWLLVGVFGFFGVHTALWGARTLVAKRHGGPPPSNPEESAAAEGGAPGPAPAAPAPEEGGAPPSPAPGASVPGGEGGP